MVKCYLTQQSKVKFLMKQLRIAIGLRLVSKICEQQKCVCRRRVTEDGWSDFLPQMNVDILQTIKSEYPYKAGLFSHLF